MGCCITVIEKIEWKMGRRIPSSAREFQRQVFRTAREAWERENGPMPRAVIEEFEDIQAAMFIEHYIADNLS